MKNKAKLSPAVFTPSGGVKKEELAGEPPGEPPGKNSAETSSTPSPHQLRFWPELSPKSGQQPHPESPSYRGALKIDEQYVHPEWWKYLFNSIYLKTDRDVISDSKVTSAEVDSFSSILNLTPDLSILDLCCGPGRHSVELASRGYQFVEGLDHSRFLIRRARNLSKKLGLNIRFREGDA